MSRRPKVGRAAVEIFTDTPSATINLHPGLHGREVARDNPAAAVETFVEAFLIRPDDNATQLVSKLHTAVGRWQRLGWIDAKGVESITYFTDKLAGALKRNKNKGHAAVAAFQLGAAVQWELAKSLDDPADIGRRQRDGAKKGFDAAHPNKKQEQQEYVQQWESIRPRFKSDNAADEAVAKEFGVEPKRVYRARKKNQKSS